MPVAACFAAGLMLPSCVIKATPDEGWAADKPAIVRSLDEAYKMQARLGEQVQALQKTVRELQVSSARQETKLRALEASVRHFSKNAPAIKKEIRQQEKASRKLVRKIDRIVSVIRETTRTAAKKKPPVQAAPQPEPPQATDEKNRYTAAYLSFKSGRYDESAAALLSIISDYPHGEYTDQAYYWLGENYEAQKKTDMAIAAYRMVVNRFPDSAKDAAALLRLGRIYQRQHRPEKMRRAFQLLLKRHPDSPEAKEIQASLSRSVH